MKNIKVDIGKITALKKQIKSVSPVPYDGCCTVFLRILHTCHDEAAKFIQLLARPSCSYLEQEDFISFLQVSIEFPSYVCCGLQLLLPDFHLLYSTSVILFLCKNSKP